MRVNQRKVILTTIVTMQTAPVYENQHVRVAQSVHLQVRPHVVLVEVERGREARQDVLDGASCILLQLTVTDNFGLHGSVFQQVLSASTRHDHFLNSIRLQDALRQLCLGHAQQCQPKSPFSHIP